MRRLRFIALTLLVLVALTLLVLVAPLVRLVAESQAHAAPSDHYVADWDAIGTQAYTASGLGAEGDVIFGYVAIATYDSVMATEGGYRPFAVHVRAPRHASVQAAVVAAAHCILVHYMPGQAPTILDPAYRASLATLPDGRAKADGIATGEQIATKLIAQRADDGYQAPVTYAPPNPPVPGVWIPTAPTPPIGKFLGHMRPFSLDSAARFRPGGPPALSSARWARDYNEVKELGSSTSTKRTAEQTLAARFWAEPPVQQAPGSFQKFVLDHGLDVVQAARFMAMISVTRADALIACFDAKYHYAFWRPITAIRAGDTDGNDATVGDPPWSPLLPATAQPPGVPVRPFVRHTGRRPCRRTVPRHTPHRLHRPEPHGPGRPALRDRQRPAGRGRERPRMGRHPLPLLRRGQHRDRQANGQAGALASLPEVMPYAGA
jgi:hypothetical protein